MSASRGMFSYIRAQKFFFSLAFFSLILSTISETAIPLLTGYIIDEIITIIESTQDDKTGLTFLVALIIISAIFTYVIRNMFFISVFYFRSKVSLNLRSDVFAALQNQSLKYYDNESTGDLVSRSTSDIDPIEQGVFSPGVIIVRSLQFISILIIQFIIDIYIGIICLIAFPLIVFLLKQYTKKYGSMYYETRTIYGQMSKVLQENIEGASVIRSFNGSAKEKEKFDIQNRKYRDLWFSISRMNAAIFPRTRLITPLLSALILIVGGYRVYSGNLSIGMFIAAVFFTQMIAQPIQDILFSIIMWTNSVNAAQRVFILLNSTPEIRDHPEAIPFPANAAGQITFENVSFSYQNEPVIENISFNIPPASKVAVLGSTGSGKTSLINLIPRYYDATEGKVTIDGIDIKQYQHESLRSKIGFVDQETFLFSRSFHDNIAFGRSNATRDEVIEVAKIAEADGFISKLTDGYETIIGEKGTTLSGGQRQRLSIARALLSDPRIVILDDSLSAVDVKTEKKIEAATEALLVNRTTVIISQRISTIRNADLIIVLDKGKIKEMGSQEELIEKDGIYKQLLDAQISGILNLAIIETKEANSDE